MPGKVYIVGAGPGDPGLITVKGLRCLQEAQVVVYDRLVDKRLLDKAKKDAQLIFVGKGPGEQTLPQEEINRLLIGKAREGKTVVRLKGGDPFVFGRGGEEAWALAQARVPFEVVPGITSAIAVPAYAGIPLTHRELSSAFTVVTGSEDPSKGESAVPWDLLARSGSTLVILMGWSTLDSIVDSLIKGGMDPSTPAALIRWGTEPYQQTVTGTLENILQHGKEAGIKPPIVAVIGQVVNLREQLSWYDNRLLFGKRILVTRSRIQASVLSEMLMAEGAEPVELPAIEIAPLEDYSTVDEAIHRLKSYQWVVFTSVNGVGAFFTRMGALGYDSRVFGGVKVAAIGPATASALALHGIKADFVPAEYLSKAIVKSMEAFGLEGSRILLPRADIAGTELVKGLSSLGAYVDELEVYRTIPAETSRQQARDLLKNGKIDAITFTSSSTVRNLLQLLEGDKTLLEGIPLAYIGPVTAQTAEELGLHVSVIAKEHTIEGLVQALKEYYLVMRDT